MREHKPLITIGVTAFNEKRLLLEAWNSVLNQSSDEWQAVMILDGSSDRKTRFIYQQIEHPRLIKYSFNDNRGIYPCRTKAIELTNTEWYFHLDADDLLPPNAVELVLSKINLEPNVEFIAGACNHFGLGSNQVIQPSNDDEVLCICPLFFAQAPIKKKLFEYIGGYYIPDHFFHSDWDFWLSVYEKQIKGAELNDIIYNRRRRLDNTTNLNFEELPVGVEKIIERHPIFFSSKQRKCKSRYDIYQKTARYYKRIGKRTLAKKYADLALQYGDVNSSIISINQEINMPVWRYYIRRLRRLFY